MGNRIDYQKVSDADEAFAVIKENITSEKIEKFKVKATLDYCQQDHKIEATGKGFKLMMAFFDDHATLDLTLSLILKPLKAKVLGALEKEMRHYL